MFRRAPWLLAGWFLLSGSVGWAGAGNDPWIHGVFVGKSPHPVAVAETEAWQRAGNMADHTFRAFVLVGSGESMEPLYGPGTILVAQQCAFTALQPGQTALYRNQAGRVVAHVLITKARDGWRATGLNNRTHDMEPVVAGNFVGVVIAAYQPLPEPGRVRVASSAQP